MRNRFAGECYFCGLSVAAGAGEIRKRIGGGGGKVKAYVVSHLLCGHRQRALRLGKRRPLSSLLKPKS